MSWQVLKIDLGFMDPQPVESVLQELGAQAITLESQDGGDDGPFEPAHGSHPLWMRCRLSALLPEGCNTARIIKELKHRIPELDLRRWACNPLPQRDWVREGQRDFGPLKYGRRLWVAPSWTTAPAEDGEIVLYLDPGLAFGTGAHETTRLCLEWLEGKPLAGRCVIDYGCGSGLLAVAAARLGAKRVWAVDVEDQALSATQSNACRNQVEERIRVLSPDELPNIKADIILANILAGPLVNLAPKFSALTDSGGYLVLSGLLEAQQPAVLNAYASFSHLVSVANNNGWLCLTLQCY